LPITNRTTKELNYSNSPNLKDYIINLVTGTWIYVC